jgi:hypothetical protein
VYLVALAEHVGGQRFLGQHAKLFKMRLLLGRHLGGIGLRLHESKKKIMKKIQRSIYL